MAKRKTKRRKSRRVGAAGLKGSTLMTLAAVAGGYFLVGDMLNDQLDKLFPKKSPAPVPPTDPVAGFLDNIDLVGVGETGLGAVLLLMGKKSTIKTIGGGVLLGAGLKRLIDGKSSVNGYQATPVIGARHRRQLGGYQATPVIGGNSNTPAQLAGTPAQLQGYRVNGYTPAGSGSRVMGSMGADELGAGIAVGSSAGYMR